MEPEAQSPRLNSQARGEFGRRISLGEDQVASHRSGNTSGAALKGGVG